MLEAMQGLGIAVVNLNVVDMNVAGNEPDDRQFQEAEDFWADQRRYKRQTVNWPACCRFGGQKWDVTIVDASNGGFGLDTRLPIAVGTNLQIVIEQVGQFECRIAWSNDTRCGLEFLRERGDLTAGQANELCSLLLREDRDHSHSISESQLDQLGALLKS